MTKWIKCSEQLPSAHTNVLIYINNVENCPEYSVGYLENDDNFYFGETEEYIDCLDMNLVSHWQPLPMPPNDEQQKIMNQSNKEEIAYLELKAKIVKLMFEFTDKYTAKGEDCLYPKVGNILVDVLVNCLSEAQYQIQGAPEFTSKQIDHICYQIGEWYLMWKDRIANYEDKTHSLGYAKGQLKTMICGD